MLIVHGPRENFANMAEGERFSVFGQFEYCDIFGTYHCQGFSTNYLSNIRLCSKPYTAMRIRADWAEGKTGQRLQRDRTLRTTQ